MALFQSSAAKGKQTPPVGYVAGAKMVAIFKHTFTEAFTAASDKLEIGMLPAGAQVLNATLVSGALGAITASAGLMSGDAGAKDDARTVGSDLLSAASVNATEVTATAAKCIAVAPADTHRGIGITLSGDVVAGSTKTLTLIVEYAH